MQELAYVNGTITSIAEARVPIEDRGYQFGDAVYEFFATYHGTVFAMPEHLERLQRSLTMLDFPPVDLDRIERAIRHLLDESGISRAGIYLQISRGVAPRNHPFPADAHPQVVITVRRAKEIPEHLRSEGAKVITVEDLRWGRCDIKSVQLLPNTLAKQQALQAGADDAIFISPSGYAREGTSSNLFIARGDQLFTHPLTHEILPGVTRRVILNICREENIPVQETLFDKKQMMAADEVFLTGTVTEVLPVSQIDGSPIGQGRPGAFAGRLQSLLRQRAGGE
ncbi:MAG: D-amino acid aminotransferase [Desulfosarcinaceae bacterium]